MRVSQSKSLILGASLLVLLAAGGANAAIYNITTNAGGNGGAGDCTFTEAVQAANSNAAVDACVPGAAEPAIDFINLTGAGGTITIDATLNLNSTITITGPGTIDGTTAGRIFTLDSNGLVLLDLLTLQNANSAGGAAIQNNGGTLAVVTCNLADNIGSSSGAAIQSDGPMTVDASVFSGNQSGTDGGAIYQSGSEDALVTFTSFTTNRADEKGGAIYVGSGSTVTLVECFFGANTGAWDSGSDETDGGGAIYVSNTGTLDASLSVFEANLSTYGRGGAVFVALNSSGASFTDCSFDANATVLADADPLLADDFNGRGGAIYNQETLTVNRCTFNGNIAPFSSGGAIANHRQGTAEVTNASFFLNTAGIDGGAIHNADDQYPGGGASTVELRNCTFDGNIADFHTTVTVNGVGGTLFNNPTDSISLWNSIVNGGSPENCVGTMTSNGYNLESGTDCAFASMGDLQSSDPLLEAPAPNGGPIGAMFLIPPFFMTQDLQLTSPALGAGEPGVCAVAPVDGVDQIGQSRPLGGGPACDIGAFESDKVPVELMRLTVD